MSSYSAFAWHDFFTAAVGASAALLGLLFVTISINLEHILKHPHLPGRAASTLGTLLTVLVVCCFGLAPTQGSRTFGWEIVLMTLLAGAQIVWVSRHRDPASPLIWTLGSLPILLVPVLVLLGGGVSLVVVGGGGIYWLLLGTALAFIGASINAWVLLVEILR